MSTLPPRATWILLTAAALVGLTGCGTPPTPSPAPAAESAETDPEIVRLEQFQKLVQRLLAVEPALTAWLDRVGTALEKPAQVAAEQELLTFLTGDAFAGALRNERFFTAPTLLNQFTPETATALKSCGLDQPLLHLVDDLAALAVAINDLAGRSEDGLALQRVFGLVLRDVLPALVEIRALVTEELLDNNEVAALTQRVEEQLQSINAQLTSLQSRAQAVSSPLSAPLP